MVASDIIGPGTDARNISHTLIDNDKCCRLQSLHYAGIGDELWAHRQDQCYNVSQDLIKTINGCVQVLLM